MVTCWPRIILGLLLGYSALLTSYRHGLTSHLGSIGSGLASWLLGEITLGFVCLVLLHFGPVPGFVDQPRPSLQGV